MFASSSKSLLRSACQSTRLLSSSARVWSEAATAAAPSTLPGASAAAASTSPLPPTSSRAPTRPGSLPDAFRAPAKAPLSTPSPSAPPQLRTRNPGQFAGGHTNQYKLAVLATRNNTILSLSHKLAARDAQPYDPCPHHIVGWVSAGSAGFKGASRGTYDAAVEASLRMFAKIAELISPTVGPGGVKRKEVAPPPQEIELIFKGFGQGREAVIRTLMGSEWAKVSSVVKTVTDATPIKVGGTRAKKRRV